MRARGEAGMASRLLSGMVLATAVAVKVLMAVEIVPVL